jgi:hypothetical protein
MSGTLIDIRYKDLETTFPHLVNLQITPHKTFITFLLLRQTPKPPLTMMRFISLLVILACTLAFALASPSVSDFFASLLPRSIDW